MTKAEYQKGYAVENREQIREYRKKWLAENKERVAAIQKKWREANKEKAAALNKRWREANPDRARAIKRGWELKNRERKRLNEAAWRAANPEKARDRRRKWREANREKDREAKQKWQHENRQKAYEGQRRWIENHREKYRETRRKHKQLKYRTDPAFRLLVLLRSRVRMALKNNSKSASTASLLGCSIDHLKVWLTFWFLPGMSWTNHGLMWHIDHIKPCAAFDLSVESQQRECFHYTNLQPLFVKENLQKGSKYAECAR